MTHFESLITLDNISQPRVHIETEAITNIVPLGPEITGEDFWTNKIKASLRGETEGGLPRIPTWQDWLGYRKETSDGGLSREMYVEVIHCLESLGLDREYIVKYIAALMRTFGANQRTSLELLEIVYLPRNTAQVFTIVSDNLFEFVPGNYISQQHDIDSRASSPAKRKNESDQESPAPKRIKVQQESEDEIKDARKVVACRPIKIKGRNSERKQDSVRWLNPIYWHPSLWRRYVEFKKTVKEKGWNQLQTVKAFREYNEKERLEPDELAG